MAMSKAHIEASNRYNAKTYKSITFRVFQGQEKQITAHAKSLGKSLNSYINDLISADMGDKLTRPGKEPEQEQGE